MKSLKNYKDFFLNLFEIVNDKIRYWFLLAYVVGFMKMEILKDKLEMKVYDADKKMRD